jgi:hypothetical protein
MLSRPLGRLETALADTEHLGSQLASGGAGGKQDTPAASRFVPASGDAVAVGAAGFGQFLRFEATDWDQHKQRLAPSVKVTATRACCWVARSARLVSSDPRSPPLPPACRVQAEAQPRRARRSSPQAAPRVRPAPGSRDRAPQATPNLGSIQLVAAAPTSPSAANLAMADGHLAAAASGIERLGKLHL